jgi:Spy/CpxP family protein refolding chaperone
MKRLAILLAVASLFSAAAPAQHRGGRGGARGAHGAIQMDEQTTIIVLSALLDLDDSQNKQLKTIFDAAAQAAAPIVVQMDNSNDALYEAVKAGKSDDEIKTLAAKEGSLTSQMLTLEAQTFAKLYAILTKDQKSQVDASMYADVAEFLSSARPPSSPPSPASPPTPPH